MSDVSGDRHRRRKTSKSSHPAGGRAEPTLNLETLAPKRPTLERLGTQSQATAHTHDLREQLNSRRHSDLRERLSSRHEREPKVSAHDVEQLQKEVETLKKQQELAKKWMRLRTEFRELCQELPPPSFLVDDEPAPQPSKDRPVQSMGAPSRQSESMQHVQTTRPARQNTHAERAISEVGESRHSTKPGYTISEAKKTLPKRQRSYHSPESTQQIAPQKKTRSIELGPFVRWIQEVSPNSSLKLPHFILYSGHSRPLEHICRSKAAMGLVTNDEAILCKAFPSTLSEKALTWFTALEPNSIDSWTTLEKLFLDKFSTTGTLPKTRGDLANIKQ